jgi:DNA repair protein SbcD/Mre11
MKILHTSDWHLGRSLYNRKRYDEFTAFLNWLAELIEKEKVDALLVAGDIFDTTTPSNRAQELYYRFLCRIAASPCRHVVVVGGNHDSPSFLNAPRELLRTLNVHVIGSAAPSPDDEVLVLTHEGRAEAIVCAVPYLRDRDVRTVEPGETIDEKNTKLVAGIKDHYARVTTAALEKREELSQEDKIPLIATGHLFTAGGKTEENDGVRELYVGSLAHVEQDTFPPILDYLALGHLHVPQKVGGMEHMRYSGSPLPMGFGEATQEKKIILVDFNDSERVIKELTIPSFQSLVNLKGSLDQLHANIIDLKAEGSRAWLEVEYTGSIAVPNLREVLEEALEGSDMEILRIKNRAIMNRIMKRAAREETLDDLTPEDVFRRCLDASDIPPEDRDELTLTYKETVRLLAEKDRNDE